MSTELQPKPSLKYSEEERSRNAPDLLFGDLWEYDPAPENPDHASFEKEYGHFIDGQFVKGKDLIPSINPATEEVLYEVASADQKEVDRAVQAARRALKGPWGKMKGSERAKYIYRIGRIMQEKARELSCLETMDNGKPIKESRDVDIPLSAAHFLYYAGWADKLKYAFPGSDPTPVGVAGQIIPWNFPLMMAAWKIAPALAGGNTVVLKPSETTPLTAMKLAEIIQEAGLPPGVVNIVNGAGATGASIVNHADVDKIAFTGSTGVGQIIQGALAGTKKRLTLELGGKGANIIFEDAPIDQAVEGVINGIFFNQGHVCCAGSRLLVQESILDTVLAKLRHRMSTLRVGNPLDKNTDIGAINSKMQFDKILKYIEIGKQEADIFQPDCSLPDRGFFVRPTFFSNASQSHRISQEEIFGPVLSVISFRTPEEAVQKANNTPYGLSAGIWSDKGSKLFSIAGALRAGVIWGNTYNKFDPGSPFGGYKESGFGREGGLHGLMPYIRL